jgi:hypothetical protein
VPILADDVWSCTEISSGFATSMIAYVIGDVGARRRRITARMIVHQAAYGRWQGSNS